VSLAHKRGLPRRGGALATGREPGHVSHHALSSSGHTRRSHLRAMHEIEDRRWLSDASRTPPPSTRRVQSVLSQGEATRAASPPASAPWATPHAPSILKRLLPPRLWHATYYSRRIERDVLGRKIPAEGSPGGCVRSPKICDRSYTPHAAQCRPCPQSHAGAWSE
jgi:hypothetical protein